MSCICDQVRHNRAVMKSRKRETRSDDRLEERLAQVEAVLAPAVSEQPEVRVLRFRTHARRLIWSVLILIAVAGASAYLVGQFPEAWQNQLAVVGAAVAVLLFVIIPYLRWLSHTTTVTTRRIIARKGLITRHRREVPLGKVRETRVRRGVLQRLWGAGDLVLFTGVEDRLVLRNVPGVTEIADVIQELVERQFAPRGPASGASGDRVAEWER